MSLFDRQGIPEWALQRRYGDNGSEVGSPRDVDTGPADEVDMKFEDDISTLTSYSLTRTTDLDGSLFEMHRLEQLSTRRWLEPSGDLERWKTRYVRSISAVFPSGKHGTWPRCRVLFLHAEVVLGYLPAESQDLGCWTAVLERSDCMLL